MENELASGGAKKQGFRVGLGVGRAPPGLKRTMVRKKWEGTHKTTGKGKKGTRKSSTVERSSKLPKKRVPKKVAQDRRGKKNKVESC